MHHCIPLIISHDDTLSPRFFMSCRNSAIGVSSFAVASAVACARISTSLAAVVVLVSIRPILTGLSEPSCFERFTHHSTASAASARIPIVDSLFMPAPICTR